MKKRTRLLSLALSLVMLLGMMAGGFTANAQTAASGFEAELESK